LREIGGIGVIGEIEENLIYIWASSVETFFMAYFTVCDFEYKKKDYEKQNDLSNTWDFIFNPNIFAKQS